MINIKLTSIPINFLIITILKSFFKLIRNNKVNEIFEATLQA